MKPEGARSLRSVLPTTVKVLKIRPRLSTRQERVVTFVVLKAEAFLSIKMLLTCCGTAGRYIRLVSSLRLLLWVSGSSPQSSAFADDMA